MTALLTPPAQRFISTIHACSNCERPTTREAPFESFHSSAVYSCPTCGQREAVSWRYVPSHLVEDVAILEEPNVILGDC